MPLVKKTLEDELYDALVLRLEYGKKKVDPQKIERQVAKRIAAAIHNYVKNATVIVNPGITTSGSPMSQVTVSVGQGSLK